MELLRADTWYYVRAKRWHLIKMLGMLLFALASPLVLFLKPGWGAAIGALAGAWVLLGRTALSWFDDHNAQIAVTIQEQFDVELFDLDWNEGLAGHRAGAEDIATAARKIHDDGHLRNWYPHVDRAPWPLNVLLCQRSSAAWGRRSHASYATIVCTTGVAWLIAGIVMAVVAHATVAAYLVTIFLPSQPAFLDTADLFRGHRRLSGEKGTLEHRIDALWSSGIKNLESVTGQHCREVQDQSYHLRRSGLQIPDRLYRLLRERDERAMQDAAARMMRDLPSDGRTDAE